MNNDGLDILQTSEITYAWLNKKFMSGDGLR